MAAGLAMLGFAAGALVSLLTSLALVSRIERVGERLGLSEAVLGILAALAADAPEITAAVTAIAHHEQRVGAGVVLGSNVFNLAALLGLGAIVARQIRLHRKVVLLGGAVAGSVAILCLAVVLGVLPAVAGLALAVVVLGLYLAVLARPGRRPRLGPIPGRWADWLGSAASEEELELHEAHRPRPAQLADFVVAGVALIVVIAASVTMERSASVLGSRFAVPEIVLGGLVLAAVTSLPNAVAAVYLAARGRGAATLSTALNSNTLNVVAGLLIPAAVLGLGGTSGQSVLITVWYVVLTAAVLAMAYLHFGIGRAGGALIIAAYLAFAGSVLATGYAIGAAPGLVTGLGIASALAFAVGFLPVRQRSWQVTDRGNAQVRGTAQRAVAVDRAHEETGNRPAGPAPQGPGAG
jgi:cation:H+ antiporter